MYVCVGVCRCSCVCVCVCVRLCVSPPTSSSASYFPPASVLLLQTIQDGRSCSNLRWTKFHTSHSFRSAMAAAVFVLAIVSTCDVTFSAVLFPAPLCGPLCLFVCYVMLYLLLLCGVGFLFLFFCLCFCFCLFLVWHKRPMSRAFNVCHLFLLLLLVLLVLCFFFPFCELVCCATIDEIQATGGEEEQVKREGKRSLSWEITQHNTHTHTHTHTHGCLLAHPPTRSHSLTHPNKQSSRQQI